MLTLTRREGESIMIGDTIRVTVKSVRGRQTRLMISAPIGIPIYREEVYRAIEEENRAAAASRTLMPAQLGRVVVSLGSDESAGDAAGPAGERFPAGHTSSRSGGSRKEGEP
jgi:carbon storage regulator